MKTKPIVWKRASRVFILALVVMVAVAFFGIISVARELANSASGSAGFSLFGLPMFSGTKSGNISTLQLEFGVVSVVIVPAVLAAATALLSARRN